MKLDHPSMCAIEHSAGGFGMPDTPTSDEGTYVGPISLHNAIGPKRPHLAPLKSVPAVAQSPAYPPSPALSQVVPGAWTRPARSALHEPPSGGPAASRRPSHHTSRSISMPRSVMV